MQTFQVFGSTKLRVSTKHSNCGEKLGWPLILKTLWISFYVEVDLTAFLKVWKNGLRWEANCCCYTCVQLNPISIENMVKHKLVLKRIIIWRSFNNQNDFGVSCYDYSFYDIWLSCIGSRRCYTTLIVHC